MYADLFDGWRYSKKELNRLVRLCKQHHPHTAHFINMGGGYGIARISSISNYLGDFTQWYGLHFGWMELSEKERIEVSRLEGRYCFEEFKKDCGDFARRYGVKFYESEILDCNGNHTLYYGDNLAVQYDPREKTFEVSRCLEGYENDTRHNGIGIYGTYKYISDALYRMVIVGDKLARGKEVKPIKVI
jgi:hypothetical protein